MKSEGVSFPKNLIVGGIHPFTTIDFPGKLAAVVFLKGCNLRCSYCHNPDLIGTASSSAVSPEALMSFLLRRRGFLDGVVFSGGEPTMQKPLYEAVLTVRSLGFEVGLHTNGMFPASLEALLDQKLISYIALDIKAPLNEYQRVSSIGNGALVGISAKKIAQSGIPFEFRTTIHPDLLGEESISKIADFVEDLGVQRFVLQKYRPGRKVYDPSLRQIETGFVKQTMITRLKNKFRQFEIRDS